MVYGEFIQKPTVELCKLIAKNLPDSLSNTYLTNSGTEAMEAAMKLAKRVTGRTELIAAKNGYHGNTQGSMSIMGYEERKRAYRPLLPNIKFLEFNNELDLTKITNTKFIIITHHALTMSRMDRLYGVTMAEQGVSQLVSVDLQRAEELVA